MGEQTPRDGGARRDESYHGRAMGWAIMSAMQADLFVTCLIDTFFPEIGESVVRVLQRAGVQLDFPVAQTCCGQPLFNTGFRDLARAQARRTLDVLAARRVPVIVPSGSCAAMI